MVDSSQFDRGSDIVVYAIQFSNALVTGNFDDAHSMLNEELSHQWTADRLRLRFSQMMYPSRYYLPPTYQLSNTPTEPVTFPLIDCDVTPQAVLHQYGDRKENDAGWVYVSISIDGSSEAVAVILETDPPASSSSSSSADAASNAPTASASASSISISSPLKRKAKSSDHKGSQKKEKKINENNDENKQEEQEDDEEDDDKDESEEEEEETQTERRLRIRSIEWGRP